MNIRDTCVYVVMVGGILLGTGGAGQAELGGGTPSGGGSSIGNGVGQPSEPKGSMNQNRTHGRAPSGPMDQGRPESMRQGQGDPTLRGKAPDTSGGNPIVPGGTRPGTGTGSRSMGTPGGTGSSGGMGAGGRMGGSGGAGGSGK